MALLQNGSILSQYPMLHTGAGVAADISAANRSARRNIYSGITDKKSGIPNGHGTPSAWLLPLKPGGMSSVSYAVMSMAATASGTMGAPITASALLAFVADAVGSLITSGTGSASFALQWADALLTASLSGSGSASASISASASLDAEGNMLASTLLAVTGTLASYAVGHMEGSTVDAGALTPDSIASAVWSTNAGDFNDAGTMGEKLNGAGSAGNPWTEVIESGLTAAEVLRIIASAMAGKVSGAGSGTETFKGLDGTTDRIVSTVDNDGNRTGVVVDGS